MKKLVFFPFLLACQPLFYPEHLPLSVITDQSITCPSGNSFHQDKILFVVDKTASNKKSDFNGNIRFKGIRKFIQSRQNIPISYGFIYFSEEPSSIFKSYGNPVFVDNAQKVREGLDQLEALPDQGKENYSAILELIEKTLEHDMRVNKTPLVDYHVFYISDGGRSSAQIEEEKQFLQGISRMSHEFQNVQIHSAYYGEDQVRKPRFLQRVKNGGKLLVRHYLMLETGLFFSERGEHTHSQTSDLLKDISERGQGQYIDYNQQTHIPFQSQFDEPWHMERFLVYNLNAGFCLDGFVGMDSDGDGLCDRDENKIEGFHADNRFSFKDGYSDYFHWKALQQQIILPACQDQSDIDKDLLTRCEEQYLNSLYAKNGMGSGFVPLKVNHPDSDGDGIIDGIEVLIYLADEPSAPLDPHNLSQIRFPGEGTDLDKILKHLSPFTSEKGQNVYDTQLISLKGENGSCYAIQQNKLPLYPVLPVSQESSFSDFQHKTNENVIFIYALRKRGGSKDVIYQFEYKKLTNHPFEPPPYLSIDMSHFQTQAFRGR